VNATHTVKDETEMKTGAPARACECVTIVTTGHRFNFEPRQLLRKDADKTSNLDVHGVPKPALHINDIDKLDLAARNAELA
jgi:hypothetical protein